MSEAEQFEEALLNLKLDSIKLGQAKSDIRGCTEQDVEFHAIEQDIEKYELSIQLEYDYLLSQYQKKKSH